MLVTVILVAGGSFIAGGFVGGTVIAYVKKEMNSFRIQVLNEVAKLKTDLENVQSQIKKDASKL